MKFVQIQQVRLCTTTKKKKKKTNRETSIFKNPANAIMKHSHVIVVAVDELDI